MESFSDAFKLAADLIYYSGRSVFLTGKAGTGKTTFLKYIKEHTTKQTAVTAPTGVAAINAGGTTLHSFFQLPFSPFIPESGGAALRSGGMNDRNRLLGTIKMNKERRSILQQLELLIIDEISMVRCDLLDAIDAVLRHFRSRHNEPFGGVQLLLIGDMYQLPPVVPDEEWRILSTFYTSPFFFSSRAMEQQQPVYVELDKIYRQSDEKFITVLNQVRNNELDEVGYNVLHKQYNPTFQPKDTDGFITLTTHNHKANTINAEQLAKLKGQAFSFRALIQQDFGEKSYPAEENLQLKIGAQVMFIKNDTEKIRRYFNGKIGTVQKIEDGKIFIQCGSEPEAIEVKKEVWKNVRYQLDEKTQQIEENEIGSFTQYPLRLAWAITIHKSQGLTFEKAVIDAGAAFAPGQVYVALSRCTSLNGVVLLSRINSSSLKVDERIVNFSKNKIEAAQFQHELTKARQEFQQTILSQLFDFASATALINALIRTVDEHTDAFNAEALPWLQKVQVSLESLQQTGTKFRAQLQQLFSAETSTETNPALQERTKAAAKYFNEQLNILLQLLPTSPAVTDSKQYSLAYNEDISALHVSLAQQRHLIQSCVAGFDTDIYYQHKNNFVVPAFNVNAYAAASSQVKIESPYPVLYKQLKKLRDELCTKNKLPVYIVAGSTTLDEMARFLPHTLEELEQISGFGKAKIEKYGQPFLDIITDYCALQNLSSLIQQREKKRIRKEKSTEPKTDTKQETYKLFKDGKTVADIAAARSFTLSTIEGHLAHFVQAGEISIEEVVSREKIVIIEPALQYLQNGSVSTVKQKLGNDISFGEIRLVMAWKEFEKRSMA